MFPSQNLLPSPLSPDYWPAVAGLGWPLAAAFLVALAGTWLGMRLAPRLGAVAQVQADRWHQSGAMPKLAGPGLLAGLVFALPLPLWLVAASACLIGCLDDRKRLAAGPKALLLLVPALAGAWVTGQAWVAPAIWIAANAWNLLDHADGLAAAAACAACLLMGIAGGPPAAAALAGFLVFNLPPARSFMGDGGSLLLGTTLVLLAAPLGPEAALAWSAVPLLDSALVVVSRLQRGAKPWIGGTDHSGHRLLRSGLPAFLLPPLYALAAALFGLTVTALMMR
jgi:UDP-GlcNAc:undecaprenyl-phosphate GlcNAc-1-phosphate transferase